ncbi:MAG: hypothetical protein DCF22_19305 [Leptolyngbya sp.]|nr:MAG: hypothetical protein DCF22_19305 [Leptolyngbya sp.]
MNELIEFHRGWMVEVTATERGWQLCCRSPLGETLADPSPYQNHQVALTTAIQVIDQFFACQSLRQVLREFYEAEILTFGEWKQLGRSLDFASRHQFTQSLS